MPKIAREGEEKKTRDQKNELKQYCHFFPTKISADLSKF